MSFVQPLSWKNKCCWWFNITQEQLLYTSSKEHSLQSTLFPKWKFAKHSWHSPNLYRKHTGNSQSAECMVVAMMWTQESQKLSERCSATAGQGQSTRRFKDQVHACAGTSSLAMGHTPVHQECCCFVVVKCSIASFHCSGRRVEKQEVGIWETWSKSWEQNSRNQLGSPQWASSWQEVSCLWKMVKI